MPDENLQSAVVVVRDKEYPVKVVRYNHQREQYLVRFEDSGVQQWIDTKYIRFGK